MIEFVNRLSIRFKLWMGFGVLLAILLAVSVIGLFALQNSRDAATTMVSEVQPAALAALEVDGALQRATASVGFYLVTREAGYRDAFESDLSSLSGKMDGLRTALARLDRPAQRRQADEVANRIQRLASFKDELLQVAVDPVLNMPAMNITNQ